MFVCCGLMRQWRWSGSYTCRAGPVTAIETQGMRDGRQGGVWHPLSGCELRIVGGEDGEKT